MKADKQGIVALAGVIAFFVVVIGVFVAGSVQKTSAGNSKSGSDSSYTTKTLTAQTLSITGKVGAANSQDVNKPDGDLVKLAVKNGDQVKMGDILMTTNDNGTQNVATAPFDGTVVVSGGSNPTVTVNSNDHVVNASVSEFDYDKVHVADDVKVTTLAGDQTKQYQITSLAQDPSDSKSSQYPLTINVGRDFRNGQSVKINLHVTRVAVPKSAIVGDHVFVVRDGRAYKKHVEFYTQDGKVLVTDGVSAGDKIVTNPGKKLSEGTKIG
ncbi:efflux RND transporter periplasmic adaptor subunit [Eupransor demetentiae]|uniref:Multidrug efflux pump subunit AcrA (Membrane-fusion protein) (AcrA) n=1 Tax=Eupransor demetentiae TaxID=3109584 RepID=A0ABM9N6Z5_9LACO|nr:Multidrug efflux pump subunit AcrA (membrane-fusion protein) (AcrA) [Lactobacillaceae bacterium LMG 33000]